MNRSRQFLTAFLLAAFLMMSGGVFSVLPIAGAQQEQVLAPRQAEAEAILRRLKQANNIPEDRVREVRILDSNDLNAATNGEIIIFSRGLWNTLQSEDQRAFVMAHELAHVTLNHVPRMQARRVGLAALGGLLGRVFTPQSAGAGQLVDVAQRLGINMIDMRFSRSAELAADEAALSYMMSAGYNPQSALQVFAVLDEHTQAGRLPEFLQSHPVSATRIQAMSRQIDSYRTAQQRAEANPQSQQVNQPQATPVHQTESAQQLIRPAQSVQPGTQPGLPQRQQSQQQPTVILRQIQ